MIINIKTYVNKSLAGARIGHDADSNIPGYPCWSMDGLREIGAGGALTCSCCNRLALHDIVKYILNTTYYNVSQAFLIGVEPAPGKRFLSSF